MISIDEFLLIGNARTAAQDLVIALNNAVLFPLIALLSAVAMVVFLYGAFEYVRNSASQEGRTTGQRHLLFGVVGLLVMFSAFTILQIAAGTFGITNIDRAGMESGDLSDTRPRLPPSPVSPSVSDTPGTGFDSPSTDGTSDVYESSFEEPDTSSTGLPSQPGDDYDTLPSTDTADPSDVIHTYNFIEGDRDMVENYANGCLADRGCIVEAAEADCESRPGNTILQQTDDSWQCIERNY